MRKITILLMFLFLAGMQLVYAQTRTIDGTATSSDNGEALPGVTVQLKGTTVGTVTNINGKYNLTVDLGQGNILVFSYVGMATQEIAIGSSNTIDVVMKPSALAINEVVVTALGVSREKKTLGYAVQEVGSEELTRAKAPSVINSLSGKVAGLSVKNSTNMGGGSNILIRGSSSLTGNNQPLFIVDGVPVSNYNSNTSGQITGRSGYDYGNPVDDINPNDIESVSVLKSGAATALYGARASNGVIMITTKKGSKTMGEKAKRFHVELNNSTMFHVMDKSTFPKYQHNYGQGYGPYYSGPLGDGEPSDYPGLYHYDFDGDGTLDYVEPTTEDASMGSPFDPDLMIYKWNSFYPELPTYNQKSAYTSPENGPDYFFKTGHTATSSLAVTSGSEHTTFRLGYTNVSATGIMPNSKLNKNTVNFSGSADILDNITVSADVNYINTSTVGRNHTGYSDNILSSFRQWFNLGVDMKQQHDFYHLNGNNITWNPNSENNLTPIYWDNPYWQRWENYQSDNRDRVFGNVALNWEIIEGLNFTARYSLDHFNFLQEERKAVGSVSGEFGTGIPRQTPTSGYARRNISYTETNFDAMLDYNKYLTDDLSLHALLGANIRRSTLDEVFAATNGGLAVPGTFALSNSISAMLPPEESFEQVGVNGYYGNVSLGFKSMLFLDGTYRYDISSTLPEDTRAYGYWGASLGFVFSELIDASWMNYAKVRASYSSVGKDAEWGKVNDYYIVVSPFGNATITRLIRTANNPNLKPEISSTMEGGLEMSLFNNRLGFELSLYKINTINGVIPVDLSYATGYTGKYVNIGEMENKGIEVSVNGGIVDNTNFKWNVVANWARNVNKVITLGGDITNLTLASLQGGVSINAREGEPYGTIQGTGFVYSPDGRPIVKSNGYYMKTGTSDIVIGNIQPDWTGGLNNIFTIGNLTASFLIDFQYGGSIFSLDQWYGMGTGLYEETDYSNDLGNPVRDPIYDADGNELLPYIDLPGYDPADGYGSNSGGMILDGVTWTDTNGDGEPNEGDTFEENIRRTSALDYRVWGWSQNPNEKFVYDATYVKLREVTLSYRLPQKWFENNFISGATIGVSGTNLWIIYKDLPHADPEASQGAGNIQGWQSGVMPATRNFGFNINLSF